MLGNIHSIETFGSADGPGVRYLIFLKGCNMRCKYCHNPDTWAKTEGEMKSAEEILQQALRYKRYWGKKGGITVSGGEALLQIDFVTELFTLAKEKGVNTCLDTAGNPVGTGKRRGTERPSGRGSLQSDRVHHDRRKSSAPVPSGNRRKNRGAVIDIIA